MTTAIYIVLGSFAYLLVGLVGLTVVSHYDGHTPGDTVVRGILVLTWPLFALAGLIICPFFIAGYLHKKLDPLLEKTPYYYQEIKEHIAEMTSEPDLENLLEESRRAEGAEEQMEIQERIHKKLDKLEK